jgi:hypothetical protein
MHRVRAAAMNSADRGTTAILQAPFQTSGGTNSPAQIEARLRAGKISPLGLALMLPARLVFAFLTFGLVTLIALASGTSHPVTAAASWWMVSGTLIDIGCLIALTLLTRREGIRLVDLLGLGNRHIPRASLRACTGSGADSGTGHHPGSYLPLLLGTLPAADYARPFTGVGDGVQHHRLAGHLGTNRTDDVHGLPFSKARSPHASNAVCRCHRPRGLVTAAPSPPVRP